MPREIDRRLIILPLSPWSERARWALDHHQLPYQKIIHAPFLGERRLRRLVGPHKPRVTVPVLLVGDQVLSESWDIALYAEREGRGAPLIPPERAAEIRGWNDRADEVMAVGRALVMGAMLASPEALDESLPPAVPGWLRPLLRPVTGYGSRWFARKYGLRLDQAPHDVDRGIVAVEQRGGGDEAQRARVRRVGGGDAVGGAAHDGGPCVRWREGRL